MFRELNLLCLSHYSKDIITYTGNIMVSDLLESVYIDNKLEYRFKTVKESKFKDLLNDALIYESNVIRFIESNIKSLVFLCLIKAPITHTELLVTDYKVINPFVYCLHLTGGEEIICINGGSNILKFLRESYELRNEIIYINLILIKDCENNIEYIENLILRGELLKKFEDRKN